MPKVKTVTLLKSGNRLVINPTTPRILAILAPHLSFTEKRRLYGKDEKLAGRKIEFIDWDLYTLDHRKRIATSFGFHKCIRVALERRGYRTRLRDLSPHPNPKVFQPAWSRLVDGPFDLRHGQEDFLVKVLSHRCGRVDCPTGYGKSFLIGVLATLLPKAKIDVISRRVPVLCERIYPELVQMLPSVGICGGGKKRLNRRVMCYTTGSLRNSPGDADIVFADESHEFGADQAAYYMTRYENARMFGFSASHDMRLDGKDKRVEAIFGPIIYKIPYQEAVDHGLVLPIKVIWRNVVMDSDPCEGETGVEGKRLGIWTNDYRNALIAEDVTSPEYEDQQVLIVCETIEHAVNLYKKLPGFTLVHSVDGMATKARRWYVKHGLLDANEPHMTSDRLRKLQRMFEKGKLKKVIATTVWNVGVDFTKLAVLARADAGGSPINDIQIPGRTSRVGEGENACGIILDYMDYWNTGFRRKAKSRENTYELQNWTQVRPGDSGRPEHQQTHFWPD
jgi:superfamily II DNA or RNA helicase